MQQVKIAIVGDVHEQWEKEDAIALKHLDIDLVLFVGDLGNESLSVVSAIAAIDLPKAIILGNHDAWYTATDWGRKKRPYNPKLQDRVKTQLDILGDTHIGYGKLDFPQFNLTVVGGRPFSWGGSEWKIADFYQERFGITGFADSTNKIVASVKSAKHDQIIFIGHNGPKGLGTEPESICGKDWKPMGQDFGDPDFTEAIAIAKQMGKNVPLVTFGHMHHHLRHTKQRLRDQVVAKDQTVYVNAARVPRIITTETEKKRNFTLVTLRSPQVAEVSLLWINNKHEISSQENLYQSASQNRNYVLT
jgi:uncharacterized protein (TIGR04168 family)